MDNDNKVVGIIAQAIVFKIHNKILLLWGIYRATNQALPQVAEMNTPQSMDVAGECFVI